MIGSESSAPQAPPDRPRLRDRQGPPGLHAYCNEWEGRIYQTRGGPDNLRWFWSMTVNPPMARSNKVATLEEADLEGLGVVKRARD